MVMAVLLLANFFVAPIPINQSVYEGVASVRGSVVDSLRHQTVAGAIVYAKSDVDFQKTVSDQKGNLGQHQLLFSPTTPGELSVLCLEGWLQHAMHLLSSR
jgi:hypothetical protein